MVEYAVGSAVPPPLSFKNCGLSSFHQGMVRIAVRLSLIRTIPHALLRLLALLCTSRRLRLGWLRSLLGFRRLLPPIVPLPPFRYLVFFL